MTETTRRAFIAATTTSLAALSAPGAALAVPRHDPVLVRRAAAYERARQIVDRWHATIFDPAAEAFKDAIAAVPHHTTVSSYSSNSGGTLHMTTASPANVAVARSILRDGEHKKRDDFWHCCEELCQAADDREAKLQQIQDDWRATGLSDRSDWLTDKCFDLYGEIYAYPARTLPDMIMKFESIQQHDGEGYPPEMILADLKRFAGLSMATSTVGPSLPYSEPADMPDLYALKAHGRCMEPRYSSGVLLVGDKRQEPKAGDVVIIHFRRDVAPQYGVPGWIKQLVQVAPDGDIITVEQINPPCRYVVPASHVAAMHKCIGTATSQGNGVASFRAEEGGS